MPELSIEAFASLENALVRAASQTRLYAAAFPLRTLRASVLDSTSSFDASRRLLDL